MEAQGYIIVEEEMQGKKRWRWRRWRKKWMLKWKEGVMNIVEEKEEKEKEDDC